jgi:hypothetical protein
MRVILPVTVTYQGQASDGRDRHAFWGPIIPRNSRDEFFEAIVLERSLKMTFGKRLQVQLAESLFSEDGLDRDVSDGARDFRASVAFRVRSISYSSLHMPVEIHGAENLPQFFKSVDVFEVALLTALPYAFQEATRVAPDLLDFTVRIPKELNRIYQSASNRVAVNQPFSEKSLLVWKILNGSLILPLVVMAWLFFVAYHDISTERAELKELLKATLEQRTEWLKAEMERSKAFEQAAFPILLKLITQPAPAPPVVAQPTLQNK